MNRVASYVAHHCSRCGLRIDLHDSAPFELPGGWTRDAARLSPTGVKLPYLCGRCTAWFARASASVEHLPGCRSVPVNQLLAERGQERFASIHIQKCADGCPILARSLERARAVARERGWLTDEGWTWEKD